MKSKVYIYILLCASLLTGCEMYNYQEPSTSDNNKRFIKNDKDEQDRLAYIIENNS